MCKIIVFTYRCDKCSRVLVDNRDKMQSRQCAERGRICADTTCNFPMRRHGSGKGSKTAAKDAMDDGSVVKDLVCHGEE